TTAPVSSKRSLERSVTELPTKRMRREKLSPLPSSAGNSADVSGDTDESETESDMSRLDEKQIGYGITKEIGEVMVIDMVEDSTSGSEMESEARKLPEPSTGHNGSKLSTPAYIDSGLETPSSHSTNLIRVVKLAWFEDSLKVQSLLPLEP